MAKRIKVKGPAPSSTRKKLVKEGDRKFIGPRTRDSEERERTGRRSIYYHDIGTRHDAERGERKVRVPEALEYLRGLSDPWLGSEVVPAGPQWGRGGIAKNKRLLELLRRRFDQAWIEHLKKKGE